MTGAQSIISCALVSCLCADARSSHVSYDGELYIIILLNVSHDGELYSIILLNMTYYYYYTHYFFTLLNLLPMYLVHGINWMMSIMTTMRLSKVLFLIDAMVW